MIIKKMGVLTILWLMIFSLPALSFDCNNPDFGANLKDLNTDGFFVKYMEKGNISYYNYTGPCKMYTHDYSNPATAFAFIDNQLYARIVKVAGTTFNPMDEKAEQSMSKKFGTDMKRKQEGNVLTYQFTDKQKKTKYKLKWDIVKDEGKTAWYYEPLREKLKSLDQAVDPVNDFE